MKVFKVFICCTRKILSVKDGHMWDTRLTLTGELSNITVEEIMVELGKRAIRDRGKLFFLNTFGS